MNLSTIDMPRAEARRQFELYRRAARDSRDAEDRAMALGYKAITEGRAVILLSETMAAGGVTKLERTIRGSGQRQSATVPRLAVCRGGAKHAWTDGVTGTGSLAIFARRELHSTNRRDRCDFPNGTFQHIPGTRDWAGWRPSVNALVPTVPPELRPDDKLSNYHILWEAEWSFAPGPPPGDPALLKHIGGDLYAVHGVWDLTPLEQAVLRGRPLES